MLEKTTQKTEKSLNSRQESEIHLLPWLGIPQEQQTAIKYIQRTWCRPLGCHFCLSEIMCALLSWVSGPCSRGVLYLLRLLDSSFPFFHGIPWTPRESPDLNLQFKLCQHSDWLWVSEPAPICYERKPRWQWLDKALISTYSRKSLVIILLLFLPVVFGFYPRSLGCPISGSVYQAV